MRVLSYQAELKIIEGLIRAQARPDASLRILEAGCGREWYFRLEGVPYELTGVDVDVQALLYRQRQKRDLNHIVFGDLRDVMLPQSHFDVIYCSFVLEHIRGARKVLDNFTTWLKPGGLAILRVPDVTGVQTFFAKLLPRWCAILYYRSAWGIKNAGKPGFAPYPAFYENVISLSGLHEYCRSRGLLVAEEIGVGTYAARGSGLFQRMLPPVARAVSMLSRGKIHDRYVDLTVVIRKPNRSASEA